MDYQLQRKTETDADWAVVATVPTTYAEVAKGQSAETVYFRVLCVAFIASR